MRFLALFGFFTNDKLGRMAFTHCSDELEGGMSMSEDTWQVVDEVSGELQAEILRGLLEAHGIEVWISQEGAGRVYQLGIGRLGKVQLLVPNHDSQRARELLDQYYAGELETAEDDMIDDTEPGEE
jgi:hypothetical protein